MKLYLFIFLLIIIFILGAIASSPVVDSIILKFEDSQIKVESLNVTPAIMLPIDAVVPHYKIDFKWQPEREEALLSKNGTEVKLILGSKRALVSGSYGLAPVFRPLATAPAIIKGRLALAPFDIVNLLSDLRPTMDICWYEDTATIETKQGNQGNGKFILQTIVIDAGHGGKDPGANRGRLREKNIVLDIAQRLGNIIESKSEWKCILTRNNDTFIQLQDRTAIANQYPADSTLFISIHCNASPSSAGRGLETYVFDTKATDREAAALAERENAYAEMDLAFILNHCYHVGNEPYSIDAAKKVQSMLSSQLRFRNRGVRRAPFYVLAGTKMPAILVELGFISNRYDRQKLESISFRQKAAEALFEAIVNFTRSTNKTLAKADTK
ncbi:hypothetical protein GF312_10005 [Candidatus Poribacteria bacterium]|nr:hypothetical protein [Candidatus Poribacteria bacterium]